MRRRRDLDVGLGAGVGVAPLERLFNEPTTMGPATGYQVAAMNEAFNDRNERMDGGFFGPDYGFQENVVSDALTSLTGYDDLADGDLTPADALALMALVPVGKVASLADSGIGQIARLEREYRRIKGARGLDELPLSAIERLREIAYQLGQLRP